MKVKFLQDFQGSETREVFYRKGQEADLPDSIAQRLVTDRRAEQVAPVVEVQYHDNEPQFENAAIPPQPKRSKRGRQ